MLQSIFLHPCIFVKPEVYQGISRPNFMRTISQILNFHDSLFEAKSSSKTFLSIFFSHLSSASHPFFQKEWDTSAVLLKPTIMDCSRFKEISGCQRDISRMPEGEFQDCKHDAWSRNTEESNAVCHPSDKTQTKPHIFIYLFIYPYFFLCILEIQLETGIVMKMSMHVYLFELKNAVIYF